MKTTRTSGILLHPTSLSGPYGIGDLGESAFRFIDFLAAAEQTIWQVLPLGPTGYGDSPYSSFSAFAGNPLLISPQQLVEVGDLTPEESTCASRPEGQADYGFAAEFKGRLLPLAARRFMVEGSHERQAAFAAFCAAEAYWLEDYALFRALRADSHHCHWRQWPASLRDRDPNALAEARQRLAEALRAEYYAQFAFHEQWRALKAYAMDRGIQILGDIPIFVADDSADVWAHRQFFQLDAQGAPLRVAGVPPDYFSVSGQRWGNPLYDWDRIQADGFAWWIARLRRNLTLYDLIRIDHFRGFEASWSIPAEDPTAINGRWEKVPGIELFQATSAQLGKLPVIAEDLGVITPEVEALRDRFGFPGMKILQFAFGDTAKNPYLPHNFVRDCVVYTGTHDNDTTAGWWKNLTEAERSAVSNYLGHKPENPARELMRLAAASVAELCIFPLQDALGLGNEARFNLPGDPNGNWRWRLDPAAHLDEAARFLAELTHLYGRRKN